MGRVALKKDRTIARLRERLEKLAAQIPDLGFVIQGSVVKRTMRCGTPTCRCHRGKEYEHGPYYEWTTKVKGKTVSRRLTPQEARARKEYIENGRKLKKLLTQMYKISEEVACLRRDEEAPA